MPVEAPTREAVVETNTAVALPTKRKTAVDFLPAKLVLTLASPYLAGRAADQAIAIAHQLYQRNRFASTLDILGEDAQRDEDCEASVQNYIQLVDAVCANPVAVEKPRQQLTISFKPSMFSTMAPKPGNESRKALDDAFDRIMRVVDYGAKHKINMTLEAEDHRWSTFIWKLISPSSTPDIPISALSCKRAYSGLSTTSNALTAACVSGW